MINLASVHHEAKSKYAYPYDEETLHIRIRTKRDDVERIKFIFGDPFNWGKSEEDPDKWEWLTQNNMTYEMVKDYSTNLHDYYFISIRPKWRRCKYGFILEKDNDKIMFGSHTIEDLQESPKKEYDIFNYFNYPFINEIDIFKAPDWVNDTIWYQIFPERFANGDNSNDLPVVLPWGSVKENVKNDMFFGGDLQGIIDHLDYINTLGITGIYFTPIFESNSTHKYDTIDYYNIDKQFGDNGVFKKLVDEAHKRGIKIMLDAVFNHCGFHHPFWLDVVEHNEHSKYKDYFHIKKFPVFDEDLKKFRFKQDENELNFDTFAFTPNMPKWNTEHPDVKKYLLDVATYWIKEYNIDGWRLDVSNEVDHEFWRDFHKECVKVKKDIYIVGENWDEANPWLDGKQFHAVMNYMFLFPIWNYFGKNISKANEFKNDIHKLIVTYPKNVLEVMFNLVDSHDTERILSICNENKEKVKLVYLFLLTFTGTPSIYYGGEIGLTGKHDPDNRRCMIWEDAEQDLDLFNHLKKLIQIRKQSKALKKGEFCFLDTIDESNHIIYQKQIEKETIMIIINNQEKNQNVSIPKILIGHKAIDIYNDTEFFLEEIIHLPSYGFSLLQLV